MLRFFSVCFGRGKAVIWKPFITAVQKSAEKPDELGRMFECLHRHLSTFPFLLVTGIN